MNKESARERQKRVVEAGGNWEEYVRLYLSEKLKNTKIEIIKGNEKEIKERSERLWKLLSLPLKSSSNIENVWGDIDLVAIKDELPITIISCKLSLHGRFTETLFWSLLYRMLTKIKVVLATPDAGRQQKEDKWESEWGTPDNPTKDRLLAQSYLDGVYVENLKEFCRGIKEGQQTVFGGIVRPLHELPEDIIKWSKDISKFLTI